MKKQQSPKLQQEIHNKVPQMNNGFKTGNNYALQQLKDDKIPQLIWPQCQSLSLSDRVQKYYQQYEKLFLQNQTLNNTLADMIERRNYLADKFNSIKRSKVTEDSVKRKRRYAKDIQRLFTCPIEKCHRGYGSEGSLSHHVRLKHLEFYQTGKYEIFIQKYMDKMEQKQKVKEQYIEEQNPVKSTKKEEEQPVQRKKGKKKIKSNVKEEDK